MPDLYQILGIRKNASPRVIQKGYRKQAMRFHHDRNPGDDDAAAKFQEVQIAWDTLGDKDKRARYDATGEVDDGRPDNALSKIHSAIALAFSAVVEVFLKEGHDLKTENVAEHMRTCLSNRNKELAKQRKDLVKVLDLLNIAVERFSVEDGGENVMEPIIRAQMAHVEKMVQRLDDESAVNKSALTVLKKCRYRADIAKVYAFGGWATATATASGS